MFALEVINAMNAEGAPERPVCRRWLGDSKRLRPNTQNITDVDGRLVGVLDHGAEPYNSDREKIRLWDKLQTEKDGRCRRRWAVLKALVLEGRISF